MGAAPQISSEDSAKFTTERIAEGDITCLRMAGVIDEAFEGKRLASTIKAPVLILDMGQVKKVSSFGIREWAEFIKLVERNCEHIYVIECPPKVVDQINMVANFLGSARVLSFYGPYRCDYCDIESDLLFQVDRDGAAIRSYSPPEQLCETCARPQYFDEDPTTFFSTVASQPQFDLVRGVGEFLANRLDYSMQGGNRRLQIDKHVEGNYTFIRLGGNLDGSLLSEKLADGLEGLVVVDVANLGNVDIAGAAEWRNFIALARQGAERVHVLDCPPVLLERVPRPEDLGDEVLSFSMPYSCSACSTTSSHLIDVEEHFEILRFATPPEMRCSNCKEPATCTAQEGLLSRLRSLPKPEVDGKLRTFIKSARKRKVEKQSAEPAPEAVAANRKVLLLVALAMTGVLGGTGFLIYYYTNKTDQYAAKQQEAQQKLDDAIRQIADKTADDRPPWVTQDRPFTGYCTNLMRGLSCVGVSAFNADLEKAQEQARLVALEELAVALAVNIEDQTFDKHVRPLYSDRRRKALTAFESVRGDVTSDAYKDAFSMVYDARSRAAKALVSSAQESAPVAHVDEYWERYEEGAHGVEEYLVYRRYDISTDQWKRMIDTYTRPASVKGGTILAGFPLLAWSHPEFEGGVVVVESKGALSDLDEHAVVVKAGDQPVRTVQELISLAKQGRTDFLAIPSQQ